MNVLTGSVCALLFIFNCCHATIRINNSRMCDGGDYPIKYMSKFKNDGDKQIAEETSWDTPVELGNNIMCSIDIFTKNNDKWEKILNNQSPLCEVKEKYGGKFAEDMLKSIGLEKCPIPKGKYKIENYPLDLSKLGYQNFPEGDVMIKMDMTEIETKKQVGCIEYDLSITK